MRCKFGGLIFGGAYTWRGLFSEFYGIEFKVTIRAECNKLDKALRYILKKDFKIHVIGVLGLGQTSNFS